MKEDYSINDMIYESVMLKPIILLALENKINKRMNKRDTSCLQNLT